MTVPPQDELSAVGRHMARGAAWMIGMRWFLRSIGMINTVILARLLTPDDFGVVAMSMIVMTFLMALSDTNVEIALLRKADAGRDHYDSAWTVKILLGATVTLVLFLVAPLVADFYDEPRVTLVIRIIAIQATLMGLENIGVVDFRRNLNFAKEFRYWAYRRLAAFVFGLILVLTIRDYTALALSTPLAGLITLALSYSMSPYRPRLSLIHARELWTFSRWLIIDHTTRFLSQRFDEVVIGRTADTATVGHYFMAGDVSGLPTREVVLPAGRALIPTFSKLSHLPDQSREAFRQVLGFLGIICFSAGVGMSAVADDLVHLLLGDQWGRAVPFFQWLALFGAMEGLVLGIRPYFMVQQGERVYALANLAFVLVLAPAVIFAGVTWGVEEIAMTRTALMALMAGAMLYLVTWLGYIRLRDIFLSLWRPALAGAAMFMTVKAAHGAWFAATAPSLLFDVVLGAAVYVASLLVLWALAGRPAAAESMILAVAGKALRRFGRRLFGRGRR